MWGVAYGGVSAALQIWMMKASPNAIEVVTSLFVATFNIGIAPGLFAGGRVVDHFGLHSKYIAGSKSPRYRPVFLAGDPVMLLAIRRNDEGGFRVGVGDVNEVITWLPNPRLARASGE